MHFFQSLVLCVITLGIVHGTGEHCCTTSRFTSKLGTEIAYLIPGSMTPSNSINTMMVDYDRDMKMDRLMGTSVLNAGGSDELVFNFTRINDYVNGMSYSFGVSSGYPYCNVTRIDPKDMDDGCVPSSLNFTGSFTLGSRSNSIMINSFDGMIDNLSWSMQRSANECAPIAFSRYGVDKYGTYLRENGIYMDVVQNATIIAGTFTIPDNCKKAGN